MEHKGNIYIYIYIQLTGMGIEAAESLMTHRSLPQKTCISKDCLQKGKRVDKVSKNQRTEHFMLTVSPPLSAAVFLK